MRFTQEFHTRLTHEEAIERVTATLKEQGFGVLTRIDMRETLQQKLGVDTPPQVILGACNPDLAHRATSADPRIAALLPCNVVVRTDGDETVIEALDPNLMGELSDNEDVRAAADEATGRLRAALEAVGMEG